MKLSWLCVAFGLFASGALADTLHEKLEAVIKGRLSRQNVVISYQEERPFDLMISMEIRGSGKGLATLQVFKPNCNEPQLKKCWEEKEKDFSLTAKQHLRLIRKLSELSLKSKDEEGTAFPGSGQLHLHVSAAEERAGLQRDLDAVSNDENLKDVRRRLLSYLNLR